METPFPVTPCGREHPSCDIPEHWRIRTFWPQRPLGWWAIAFLGGADNRRSPFSPQGSAEVVSAPSTVRLHF